MHKARHALTTPHGTSADRATEVASVSKRTPKLSECSPLDGPSEMFEAVFTLSNHALQPMSSMDLWTLSTMAMPTSLSDEPLTRQAFVPSLSEKITRLQPPIKPDHVLMASKTAKHSNSNIGFLLVGATIVLSSSSAHSLKYATLDHGSLLRDKNAA